MLIAVTCGIRETKTSSGMLDTNSLVTYFNELINELFFNKSKIEVLREFKLEEISLLYYQQSYISISIFLNKLIFLLEKKILAIFLYQ